MKYTLDMSDFNRKMKVLGNLDTRYTQAMNRSIDEITAKLESKLFDLLADYDLLDSGLGRSIRIVPIGLIGISIQVASDYAVFVEFGTGIVGQNGTPHPQASKNGWEYDVNEHGYEGWWYPTTESDPNRIKRVGTNGELFGWTRGQESRPFMYQTWLYGTRIAYQITMKNMRRVGL